MCLEDHTLILRDVIEIHGVEVLYAEQKSQSLWSQLGRKLLDP